MDGKKITKALEDVRAEEDPSVKSLKLASLCTALWRERGVELVVVGGSAIEMLTEGAYASGDLDLCHTTPGYLAARDRQEVMGLLGGKGGPRSWQVAGMFVDILGPVESFARTPYRRVEAPYGTVLIMKPEDLLVERILVSVYPEKNDEALACARELAVVALKGVVETDWQEVLRVAARPEYSNLEMCKTFVNGVAREIKVKSPYDTD